MRPNITLTARLLSDGVGNGDGLIIVAFRLSDNINVWVIADLIVKSRQSDKIVVVLLNDKILTRIKVRGM